MKKIRIIDLLNKIANGEEVPKKIKYKTWTFIYVDDFYSYMKENYLEIAGNEVISFMGYIVSMEELNDEVEILEEKKIPNKIQSIGEKFYCDNIDSWIDKEKTSAYCEYLMNKYNDLIDYLESKEKGE